MAIHGPWIASFLAMTNHSSLRAKRGNPWPLDCFRHCEVRPLAARRLRRGGMWEVRIRQENRIARILFVLEGSTMVLLHGFIKKTSATPKTDLDLAKDRFQLLRRSSS